MSIAVYGDIIIDEYIYGTSTRLSPEAPVPVVDFQSSEFKCGGANNVFKNIQSLTSDVSLCTTANEYPVKKRVYADGHYITRIDVTPKDIQWKHEKNNASVVVFSDYNKGAFNEFKYPFTLVHTTAKIIVDPKRSLDVYSYAYCIKPNLKEFESFVGTTVTLKNIKQQMEQAYKRLHTDYLVVTMGSDGVAVFAPSIGFVHIPSEAVEVSDVTGAGDTFTAVLAYGVHKGMEFVDAVRLANKASGVAVKHHGTYVITPADIGIHKEVVVFTNGCFDVLHPGHIKLLREAKHMGNKLIVGINDDASITRLKGPMRPINILKDRISMLSALNLIDEFHIFSEDTPIEVIKRIKPDIIVKGEDYKDKNVVGSELAKVVLVPTLGTYSSSAIIERIQNATDRTS